MADDELRNEKRYQCSVRFLGASTTMLVGEVNDLSATGLSLTTQVPVEKGKQLHLEFSLPTGEVEAVGEVRWQKKKSGGVELGIRFVRISAASQKVIENANKKPDARSGSKWQEVKRR